jgi:hypothetical protein
LKEQYSQSLSPQATKSRKQRYMQQSSFLIFWWLFLATEEIMAAAASTENKVYFDDFFHRIETIKNNLVLISKGLFSAA